MYKNRNDSKLFEYFLVLFVTELDINSAYLEIKDLHIIFNVLEKVLFLFAFFDDSPNIFGVK